MTETPAKHEVDTPAAEALAQTQNPTAAITDFGIDTTSMSTGEAVRDYFARLRAGALGSLPSLLGLLIVAIGIPANAWVEILLAICVGTAIGCITGFLVSKIGMPSFVVTLALFIVWQGVLLQFIGEGGTIGITTSDVLYKIANGNLDILGSWLFFLVAAGGFAVITLISHFRRLQRGLVVQPTALVMIKVGALVVLSALGTWLLTINRSPNKAVVTIEGVPYVIPIMLVLLVVGT